ncbi:hypothetical protein [Streptomyces noursei]|uniref:hypothetical protein n=1 Tax=Streptomyces noursei TaxID=1971 RepID=UPI00382EF8CE
MAAVADRHGLGGAAAKAVAAGAAAVCVGGESTEESTAARRALRVDGPRAGALPLAAAPHVVELVPSPTSPPHVRTPSWSRWDRRATASPERSGSSRTAPPPPMGSPPRTRP